MTTPSFNTSDYETIPFDEIEVGDRILVCIDPFDEIEGKVWLDGLIVHLKLEDRIETEERGEFKHKTILHKGDSNLTFFLKRRELPNVPGTFIVIRAARTDEDYYEYDNQLAQLMDNDLWYIVHRSAYNPVVYTPEQILQWSHVNFVKVPR